MIGAMLPLGKVDKVVVAKGAPGIRTENALHWAYIYVDIRDCYIGSYVADAKKAVASKVKFPSGDYVTWSGHLDTKKGPSTGLFCYMVPDPIRLRPSSTRH